MEKVTRRDLENYAGVVKELEDVRRRRSAAEAKAKQSARPEDAERACREAALFDAVADWLEKERLRIESALTSVTDSRAREAMRMRYYDGKSDVEIGVRLHYSDRSVRRLIDNAIMVLEKG